MPSMSCIYLYYVNMQYRSTKMENLYLIESFLSFVSEEDWQNDKGRNQQNEQGN